MTFGNFILQLRERLQDLRKADASLITLPSEDGVRWTASSLMNIANQSFLELTRMISIHIKSPAIRQMVGNEFFISPSVTLTTGSNGIIALGSSVLSIIEMVVIEGGVSTPVVYVSPTVYISYLSSDTKPRKESKFFTIMYDETTSTPNIYTINVGASKTVTMTYIFRKGNYTSDNYSTSIYLTGLDDLLLDMAERECRDREHNWERSKMLDVRIMAKLSINIREMQ
jgi:hypothetical protein